MKKPYAEPVKLDEKGRCCGRKPLLYKGGSWRSPLRSPLLWSKRRRTGARFCFRCHREFDPETGTQRDNEHWRQDVNPHALAHFVENERRRLGEDHPVFQQEVLPFARERGWKPAEVTP